MEKTREYNSVIRKKIAAKIESIIDKNDQINIYNIITDDIGNNFSSNTNGIFINMNILSDNCIDKIINYMDKINYNNQLVSDMQVNSFKIDDIDIMNEIGHKLTNQEKNLIKRNKN